MPLYKSFRVYSAGQQKLSFLKNQKTSTTSSFDPSLVEFFSNEDMWQEFVDINLAHWNNSNLRKIAEDAGLKDLYDQYYSWSSSYVHGHWAAIRETSFDVCINPLHRFHRIPTIPNKNISDVSKDCCEIVNELLSQINTVYPGFDDRITLA